MGVVLVACRALRMCSRSNSVPSSGAGDVVLGRAGDEVEAWFPGCPSSGGEARRFVRETCADKVGTDVVEDAVLMTSELVTNAVLHARSRTQVKISQSEGRLRVSVTDCGCGAPQLGCAETTDEAGRGLTTVDELAASWGVTVGPVGKTVWFTLDLVAAH
jgi:anti-sigma regulatory factor (Ser/Thr protein kinase)